MPILPTGGTPVPGTLAERSGSASAGRPPVMLTQGQCTSDPVRLALWAGPPSVATEPPDPPAIVPTTPIP